MPKPSRFVRVPVQPEVEPMEQANTLALLPMAFLPAWVTLEKFVVASEVAAGAAGSTLMGCPRSAFLWPRLSRRLQGEAGRGCAACWAAGSGFHHAVPLCAPQDSPSWTGCLHALGHAGWMDGWGQGLQAVAPSTPVCGTVRMQDIAGYQTPNLEFLRGWSPS